MRPRIARRSRPPWPAASEPSVWPDHPLVELHGVPSPNTAATAWSSIASFAPRAGARAGSRNRSRSRASRPSPAPPASPRPPRRRPEAATTCGSRRCWRRSPAGAAGRRPVPPARTRQPPRSRCQRGRRRRGGMAAGDTRSSAAKPCSVMWHSVSTPPTTTASQIPAAIRWSASMKLFALDAQAADTTKAGPRQAERGPHVAGGGEHVVGVVVIEPGRQRAVRTPRGIGFLAGQHAEVLVPITVAIRSAPCRAIAARTAWSNPSVRSAGPRAGCCGNRTPPGRPADGAPRSRRRVRSSRLHRNRSDAGPDRRSRSAASVSAAPIPIALTAVLAVMASITRRPLRDSGQRTGTRTPWPPPPRSPPSRRWHAAAASGTAASRPKVSRVIRLQVTRVRKVRARSSSSSCRRA